MKLTGVADQVGLIVAEVLTNGNIDDARMALCLVDEFEASWDSRS